LTAKKSILFITVTFPPRLSVASLRLHNYAKLFSDHGWNVHILTCAQKGEKISDEFDLNGLNICHVDWKDPFDFTFKIKNLFLRKVFTKGLSFFIPYLASWWPDLRFRNWRKNTITHANELIKKEQITHVYSSFSPPSPHMVAHELKKKNKHIVWIAEFRDLMSFSHANTSMKKLFAKLHFRYETRLLESASDILCVSKGHAEFLQEKLGRKVNVLLNGCDFSQYENIEPEPSSEFTITYTGNIYLKRNDIQLFLKAIQVLVYAQNKKIKLKFVGTPKSTYLLSSIQKNKLQDHVIFLPKMSHNEVKKIQKSAHLLLHFCWSNKLQEGNLTGKIFEYISARVPILSVGEQNELKSILNETKSGKICSTLDDIIDFIDSIYCDQPKLIKMSNETCYYSKLNQFKNLENRII
jgi:glycosyltransferase involved in cell wall biosynthesis